MRIALVVTGGLHPSGREQIIPVLLTLVEHLAREHEVHAFALRHLARPTTYLLRGATVHDLGRPRGRIQQGRSLLRALRHHGPFDVLHGYWIDPSGALVAALGKRLGAPSVVTCDSGEFVSLPQIGYGLQRSLRTRALVSTTAALAQVVHVASEFMETLARGRGIAPIRIPVGIDLSNVEFTRVRSDGPPWRLLQVAGLNRVKDQPTLLRALATLRRTIDARLDLVGEDTLDGALQRQAAALELSDAVTFHGFLPNDRLAPLHRAAHLYVQSSLHEGSGVSVLEAAASGVPIVGTRVGFVSDWHGRAAVAVLPGDHEALAAAIADLLRRSDRRRDLAQSARAWVEQHDANTTAHALTDLYRSLSRR